MAHLAVVHRIDLRPPAHMEEDLKRVAAVEPHASRPERLSWMFHQEITMEVPGKSRSDHR